MTIEIITAFFGWCTVINTGLLLFSFLFITIAKSFVLKLHGMFFKLSEDDFNIIMYKILAYYKISIIMFNLVPYIVLRIIRW